MTESPAISFFIDYFIMCLPEVTFGYLFVLFLNSHKNFEPKDISQRILIATIFVYPIMIYLDSSDLTELLVVFLATTFFVTLYDNSLNGQKILTHSGVIMLVTIFLQVIIVAPMSFILGLSIEEIGENILLILLIQVPLRSVESIILYKLYLLNRRNKNVQEN